MTALVAALALALALAGCSSGGSSPVAASTSVFFVDPTSDAARTVAQWRAAGRADDADLLDRVAQQPVAHWVTGDPDGVRAETHDVVARARTAGKVPVITGYDVPQRDCGLYSAGGARDALEYARWVDELARGIGDTPTVVILEPDAVPHALDGCLPADAVPGRLKLLASAVGTLSTKSAARVYIDAGNPGFISDTARLAGGLAQANIAQAAGFALNVSNFLPTDQVVAYGRDISARVGGAHFVIDTGRNGAGPYTGPNDGGPPWCNPPGRSLGTPPTDTTRIPGVDAFLWVKEPGDSDGACRPGEPNAGVFWPDYALALARGS